MIVNVHVGVSILANISPKYKLNSPIKIINVENRSFVDEVDVVGSA